MPYLIDGHNLIPKLGMDLSAFDDESELVQTLNEFCRISRRGGLEIFFDNAPPGVPSQRRMGLVTAHFVRRPQIADEAIRQRLRALKNAARNWSVVSSDHRVQTEARAAGARVISSEEFARTVSETLRAGPPAGSERPANARDVDEWLDIFGETRDDHPRKF